uniref:Transmembrane protein 135 N-terminal domain-containing protein n=1 Tax=Kalmanozyma brasiliensis (strain GHG001) TaxID=1365824 RepID=V5ESJ9_KALBG
MVAASTLRAAAAKPTAKHAAATAAGRLIAKEHLESLLMPAAKAYLLGYVMDILPAILKALIRFVTAELKRIRASEKRLLEERKVAKESGQPRRKPGLLDGLKPILPSFYRLPSLLHAIAKALLVALGPNGMALSCFLAMAGWRISETLVWWPIAKYYALKLANPATSSEAQTMTALRHARVASTFVASALSSALAMMMLQHQSEAAMEAKKAAAAGAPLLTIDTTPGWIPKSLRPSNLGFLSRKLSTGASAPRIASLAPAGHFLSRLTSLTVPGSPSPFTSGNAGVSSPALGRPSPTIDLTLFALVRGMDTLVRALAAPAAARKDRLRASTSAPSATAPRSGASKLLRRVALGMADQAEGLVFVVCCAQIMWSWFYHPERLPPTYVKWITNLATMDERLLVALRCIHSRGTPLRWEYQSKKMTPNGVGLLGSLSEALGHPYEWGDPTRLPNTSAQAREMIATARAAAAASGHKPTHPHDVPGFILNGAAGPRGRGEMGGMPCELVHCGTGGASCYRNALYRWIRGFRMSMAIYFPVHLLPRLLFNPKGFLASPLPNLLKVLTGAARSAAFLATYIVGNWFPICLARTALLPRLFPNVPFNFWDAGIGPAIGSVACGFSIFIEEKRKRAEMALYVAPRALFAMVESARPGWLSQGEQTALWAERATFGAAVGTVVCAARYRPDLLRGITAAMGWVARPPGLPASGRNYARDA